jgi:hypothetical protein
MSTRHDDRGAVLIWVAVMLPIFLGLGAYVVDIGALYDERRQLQNGADAAAFAVAEDCARGNCQSFTAMAAEYANANARDGATEIEDICGNALSLPRCPTPPPGTADLPVGTFYVHVKTKTLAKSGGDKIPFILAPILNVTQTGQTVRSSATVAWGALGSSQIAPIGLPTCAFNPDWIGPNGELRFPGTVEFVPLRSATTTTCPRQTVEGTPSGFNFFDSAAGCTAGSIMIDEAGTWLTASNTGADDIAKSCKDFASVTASGPVIMPVFDVLDFTGSPARFRIIGFAAVQVCQYNLQAGVRDITGCRSECDYGDDRVFICGRFTSHVASDGTFASSERDFGVRLIKAVG